MDTEVYVKQFTDWMMGSGLRVLLIVILTLVSIRLARILSFKLLTIFKRGSIEGETEKRLRTLSALIRYILVISIFSVALIMILGEFGVAIGPLLAAAGIVGVAVGFGAQHLVQDIISGFFIIVDDEIRVGDFIQTSGKSGIVENVNLRMTVLRDFSGNVHYIRNGMIDIVTNMTKDYSRYMFEIGVAYREDVDEVFDIIREVDEDLRNDPEYKNIILEPIEIMGLDQFADSALIIKARTKTIPIKQWKVAREFNRRLKKAFDLKGIEIPFPHRTVYAGQGKKGEAAPIRIFNVTAPETRAESE